MSDGRLLDAYYNYKNADKYDNSPDNKIGKKEIKIMNNISDTWWKKEIMESLELYIIIPGLFSNLL